MGLQDETLIKDKKQIENTQNKTLMKQKEKKKEEELYKTFMIGFNTIERSKEDNKSRIVKRFLYPDEDSEVKYNKISMPRKKPGFSNEFKWDFIPSSKFPGSYIIKHNVTNKVLTVAASGKTTKPVYILAVKDDTGNEDHLWLITGKLNRTGVIITTHKKYDKERLLIGQTKKKKKSVIQLQLYNDASIDKKIRYKTCELFEVPRSLKMSYSGNTDTDSLIFLESGITARHIHFSGPTKKEQRKEKRNKSKSKNNSGIDEDVFSWVGEIILEVKNAGNIKSVSLIGKNDIPNEAASDQIYKQIKTPIENYIRTRIEPGIDLQKIMEFIKDQLDGAYNNNGYSGFLPLLWISKKESWDGIKSMFSIGPQNLNNGNIINFIVDRECN